MQWNSTKIKIVKVKHWKLFILTLVNGFKLSLQVTCFGLPLLVDVGKKLLVGDQNAKART